MKYNLKISKKFKLNINYPKIKKHILISPNFINCIKIISNSNSYTSGIMPYTNSDFSNINYQLAESQKNFYIDFITNKDSRLIKVRIIKNKAVLIVKGINPKYNHYIIFEDKDGRIYESAIRTITTKKKLRIKTTKESEQNQKRRKRTILNVNSKR